MSKRYGRNQKRAHREEIAKWKAAYDSLSQSKSNDLHKANSVIKKMVTIIESVCQHSVAIDPKIYYGTEDPPEKTHLYKQNMATSDFIIGNSKTVSYDTIDLFKLEAYIRSNAEQFTKAVHLVWGNKKSAYMLSQEALESLPEEFLKDQVVPQIIDELIQHIK